MHITKSNSSKCMCIDYYSHNMSRYNDGCDGCGCFGIIIILVLIFGAIKSCTTKLINGEKILPNFGSSRVSGGSGGYGTSNGANIHYQHSTTPNYNSSTKDLRNTNSSPTEFRTGRTPSNSSSSNSSSSSTYNSGSQATSSRSSSYGNSTSGLSNTSPSTTINHNSGNSSNQNSIKSIDEILNSSPRKQEERIRTCSKCNGTGKQQSTYWFRGYNDPISPQSTFHCGYCDRTDTHTHQYEESCSKCLGKGQVKVISSPLGGEMEVFITNF